MLLQTPSTKGPPYEETIMTRKAFTNPALATAFAHPMIMDQGLQILCSLIYSFSLNSFFPHYSIMIEFVVWQASRVGILHR